MLLFSQYNALKYYTHLFALFFIVQHLEELNQN